MSTEIRGVVTRATGSWYDVLHEGRTIACRIRGRIRLKGVRSTNPVVVGDEVVCTEGGDGEWVIERILPRRNYIIRRASNLSKESHIIAANIDQALLVATLSQPVTAPEFLDRFLATCEAYKIPATILLAKYDLAAADPEAAAAFHATYESAGYRVVDLSTLDGTGLDAVRALVAGRTTLDAFLASQFIGKALVIECSDLNEGKAITLERILQYGKDAENADFLLFHLGWDKRWGTDAYFGDYPCLDDAAMDYIIAGDYKGIGFDVIGLDPIADENLSLIHI